MKIPGGGNGKDCLPGERRWFTFLRALRAVNVDAETSAQSGFPAHCTRKGHDRGVPVASQ